MTTFVPWAVGTRCTLQGKIARLRTTSPRNFTWRHLAMLFWPPCAKRASKGNAGMAARNQSQKTGLRFAVHCCASCFQTSSNAKIQCGYLTCSMRKCLSQPNGPSGMQHAGLRYTAAISWIEGRQPASARAIPSSAKNNPQLSLVLSAS